YAYLLLCTHFADTCAIADAAGDAVGFVGGYLKPSDPSVLFVWQIGVDPVARRHGVAARLLQEVLARPACRGVRYLEATVTPSNAASRRLFHSLARVTRATCHETPFFLREHFAGEHEQEHLLRIGPLKGPGDHT